MKAISLYTGAGGLDLGFEAAGIETAVAVESDLDAVATLRANRDWPIVADSIHSDTARSHRLLELAGLRVGDADILIGGPPCQPFSKSGYWFSGDSRRLEDPRASTLGAYLRVLREIQPRAFLIENVAGLAYSDKDEGLLFLRSEIDRINAELCTAYSFSVKVLSAVEYGVPQDRERVFVIGSRDGAQFVFPEPTHTSPIDQTARNRPADGGLNQSDLEPYLTAWDAIGDLQEDADPNLRVSGKWADLLPSIPEGRNYLHHTDRGEGLPLFGWRRRYWSFLLKLAKRLPSWTITADPGSAIGPFHWRNRRLSTAELLRLQTFPAGYQITGGKRAAQRQLGNAVPSALAQMLALAIRQQLFRDKEANVARVTLVPPRRADLPDADPVTDVPSRYADNIGEHEPHPGEGLGPGAMKGKRVRTLNRLLALVGPSRCEIVNAQAGWPALVRVEVDGEWVPLAIHVGLIGRSHRGRDSVERRFQNPGQSKPIVAQPGYLPLLLGLWEEGTELAVVAMEAAHRVGRETRMSLFIPLTLLEQASNDGWAQQANSVGEMLFAFHPLQLPRFVQLLRLS